MNPEQVGRLQSIDPRALGRRLRDARLAVGLTQAQVAEPDATAAHMSRIEAGHRRPSANLLERLVGRLSITIDELFTDSVGALADIWLRVLEADWHFLEGSYDHARELALLSCTEARAFGQTSLAHRAAHIAATATAALRAEDEANAPIGTFGAGHDSEALAASALCGVGCAHRASEEGGGTSQSDGLDCVGPGLRSGTTAEAAQRREISESEHLFRHMLHAVQQDAALEGLQQAVAASISQCATEQWEASVQARELGCSDCALDHAHAAVVLLQIARVAPQFDADQLAPNVSGRRGLR